MVIEFKQGDEIAKHSTDPIDNEGVCWALALKWVSLSLHGKSDEGLSRIGRLRSWVRHAIALQTTYREVSQKVDVSSFENPGVLKASGLIEHLGREVNIKLDRSVRTQVLMTMDSGLGRLDAIADRLRTAGTGHILSFQFESTGHAMAARARSSGFWHTFGNEVFLFDPNEGEADLNKEGVKIFLRNYFKSSGAKTLLIVKVTRRG